VDTSSRGVGPSANKTPWGGRGVWAQEGTRTKPSYSYGQRISTCPLVGSQIETQGKGEGNR